MDAVCQLVELNRGRIELLQTKRQIFPLERGIYFTDIEYYK